MKRIFEIEWSDKLGPMWMNQDSLLSCLNGEQHCGSGLITTVRDVTRGSHPLLAIRSKLDWSLPRDR